MAKDGSKPADGQTSICQNRRALHRYTIVERLEAGLVLTGTEVKACRAGQAHLNDAFVQILRGEAMLLQGHIGAYSHGNAFNHPPERPRKLLMHRREIDRLDAKLRERGQTAVALALYFKDGRVKVEVGLGTGKNTVDRRADIRDRDVKREMARMVRNRRR